MPIVSNHDRHTSSLFGTSHSAPHLFTKHISSASCSNTAIEPAITPVDQAKAIDLAIIPRCFDQALPTPPLATPDARQRRMQGDLDLILQVHVGSRQQPQQPGQILGQLVPQQRIRHQVVNGWRLGRCRGRYDGLHPDPFFTQPACSVDLRLRLQVGRLQT